jgi:hypothetical protein
VVLPIEKVIYKDSSNRQPLYLWISSKSPAQSRIVALFSVGNPLFFVDRERRKVDPHPKKLIYIGKKPILNKLPT